MACRSKPQQAMACDGQSITEQIMDQHPCRRFKNECHCLMALSNVFRARSLLVHNFCFDKNSSILAEHRLAKIACRYIKAEDGS
jgi:hypothetical protein